MPQIAGAAERLQIGSDPSDEARARRGRNVEPEDQTRDPQAVPTAPRPQSSEANPVSQRLRARAAFRRVGETEQARRRLSTRPRCQEQETRAANANARSQTAPRAPLQALCLEVRLRILCLRRRLGSTVRSGGLDSRVSGSRPRVPRICRDADRPQARGTAGRREVHVDERRRRPCEGNAGDSARQGRPRLPEDARVRPAPCHRMRRLRLARASAEVFQMPLDGVRSSLCSACRR